MLHSVAQEYVTCQIRQTFYHFWTTRPSEVNISGIVSLFVCVEVLRPSQPNGIMSSAVSFPSHTFTGQA